MEKKSKETIDEESRGNIFYFIPINWVWLEERNMGEKNKRENYYYYFLIERFFKKKKRKGKEK